ncbi:hypothetical protein FS749_013682 [Ceratobasidium sp. UAMH 11750]|nr:hypothetical protein FS749_013682 [Ceratobasidium sp. UAMH 11750]
MTSTPLVRVNSGLGEGKFWATIADETQVSARALETMFSRLGSMIAQTKTFSECYIATPLQLSAARRELVSSATKAAFRCTDGGAHVVHEVYAAADALCIHPAEVEERPAAIVSPNGATYLLGEYAAMFTLLNIIPPPFDMQQTSKHGTPHVLVFLQDNPSSESPDETFGAKHVPVRWEHVDIIARGAAILASYSLFQEPVTILPLALNIVLHGSYSHTLVPRFSALPRRVDVTLTTAHDSQRSATIELREGSRPFARDNLPLARLVLGDLVPSPAGALRIEVVVVIDKYLSAIEVEAVESKSGVRAKQVVERGVVLYEDGVLEAQQESEEDRRSADNFLREHFDWTSEGNQYRDAVRLFYERDEHDEL